MKKTNKCLKSAGALLMVLTFLILSSCQKDLFVKKDGLSGLPQNVTEAARWYKNQVIPLAGDTVFSSQNYPEWEKTKVVKQKNYSLFTVPVYINGKISRELTITSSETGYTGVVREYDRSRGDYTLIYAYTINGRLIERSILMANGAYRLLGTSPNINGNSRTIKTMGSEGGFPDPTDPTNPTDPSSAQQYSESEAISLISALSNPVTGDGIELYLVANYKGSKTLNLSVFSIASNAIIAGQYTLTPHYSSNGILVFYAAFRNSNNGIEYIIKANYLSAFQSKIAYYTAAAELVYAGGIPSRSQIMVMSGDYVDGLWNMWSEAISSPAYYAYIAHVLFGIGTNLPTSSIEYTSITLPNSNKPNFRIDNMSFQEYKNALSSKYGAWQPTSTSGVENITSGSYRWTARTIAAGWPAGFTIDYYKVSTSNIVAKIRFND